MSECIESEKGEWEKVLATKLQEITSWVPTTRAFYESIVGNLVCQSSTTY